MALKQSFRKRKFFEVFCCKCGDLFNYEEVGSPVFPTKKEAVETVKEYGWTVKGDHAYCPDCQRLLQHAVINQVCAHPSYERIKLEGGNEQCGKCWEYIE